MPADTTTEQAFRELAPALHRWFTVRGAGHDADDLVQETFLRVHAQLADAQDIHNREAWIRTVARNLFLDRIRRRSTLPLADTGDLPAPEPDDEDHALDHHVGAWLRHFLTTLPEPYRVAVDLAEVQGLNQQQVADRLSLSLSGAKSRIQRGRDLLRRRLLDCCHVEVDRRGHVLDVMRRKPECDC